MRRRCHSCCIATNGKLTEVQWVSCTVGVQYCFVYKYILICEVGQVGNYSATTLWHHVVNLLLLPVYYRRVRSKSAYPIFSGFETRTGGGNRARQCLRLPCCILRVCITVWCPARSFCFSVIVLTGLQPSTPLSRCSLITEAPQYTRSSSESGDGLSFQ